MAKDTRGFSVAQAMLRRQRLERGETQQGKQSMDRLAGRGDDLEFYFEWDGEPKDGFEQR